MDALEETVAGGARSSAVRGPLTKEKGNWKLTRRPSLRGSGVVGLQEDGQTERILDLRMEGM